MAVLSPAAVCLWAALFASGPEVAEEVPFFNWPSWGARLVETVEVGGETRAAGATVRLRRIRIRAKGAEVGRRYAEAFSRAGLFLAPSPDRPAFARGRSVTALDPQRRVTYTVFWEPAGEDSCWVLMGEASWSAKGSAEPQVPVFPGARFLTEAQDEGWRVLGYQVTATREEVFEFYARTLVPAGYSEREAEGGGRTFFTGDVQLTVNVLVHPSGGLFVQVESRP